MKKVFTYYPTNDKNEPKPVIRSGVNSLIDFYFPKSKRKAWKVLNTTNHLQLTSSSCVKIEFPPE